MHLKWDKVRSKHAWKTKWQLRRLFHTSRTSRVHIKVKHFLDNFPPYCSTFTTVLQHKTTVAFQSPFKNKTANAGSYPLAANARLNKNNTIITRLRDMTWHAGKNACLAVLLTWAVVTLRCYAPYHGLWLIAVSNLEKSSETFLWGNGAYTSNAIIYRRSWQQTTRETFRFETKLRPFLHFSASLL